MDIGRLVTVGTFAIIVVWLVSKIKTLPDNQRVAMFKLGKFERFLGPGLIIQYEKGVHQWKKSQWGRLES